jgi:uncharacterized membrane protein YczE
LETGIKPHGVVRLRSRLRLAGILLIIGLLIEILSFFWVHPLAFMGFLVIGCLLLGLGIVLFLWTLVSVGKTEPSA